MNTEILQATSAAPDEQVVQGVGDEGREIEVKFRTDIAGLAAAFSSPLLGCDANVPSRSLRSIYFDTPAADFRKNDMILRIRETGNDKPVLCFKAAAAAADGPFSRTEVEVASPDLKPNFKLFDEDLSAALGKIAGDQPLKAMFETVIQRRTTVVNYGRSSIEVAFDDGHIVSGATRLPLTEVELELKTGDETDLYDLAIKLARDLPLRLDFVSKGEKGFRSSLREKVSAIKAKAIEFAANATLDDAVTAVVASTLAHFVSNWAGFREAQHPESVHQMRVALRRMRSALAMFNRVLPCPEFDVLRAEAKRIASAMGAARESDVFSNAAGQGPLAHPDRPAGSQQMAKRLEKRRTAAYAAVLFLLEDSATSIFVLKVQDFLARRAWRNALSGAELPRLTQPACEFASEMLSKLRARALKRGTGFASLNDEARHELRIALKNLRYGAEFFGPLFERERTKKSWTASISTLQDLLGVHNDGVSARAFMKDISATTSPDEQRATGFAMGWFARGDATADDEQRTAWKAFKNSRQFWR